MELPKIFQGESLTRLMQGMAMGAVATIAIGFSWGGWMLGSRAAQQSADSVHSAVVGVLAPICVDKFQAASDAPANLINLKKESGWNQGNFIEKGGWAILPGNDKAGNGVAAACAALLNELK